MLWAIRFPAHTDRPAMSLPHRAAPAGVHVIDTLYGRPRLDACYLLVDADEAALVDTGPANSADTVMAAIAAAGVSPSQVRYLILTHVHLDHAGGAGMLMQRLPAATLVVHPRGARHMIDPGRLWAGAAAVYGEAEMERSFGAMVPVPAERVLEAPEGTGLALGGRRLHLLDTPGHARHHLCVWDADHRTLLAGDTFGLCFPELDTERGPFIFPTSAPVQFDPHAWHATLRRFAELDPECVCPTHYGPVRDIPPLIADLDRRIDEVAQLARKFAGHPAGDARHEGMKRALREHWIGELRKHGCRLSEDRIMGVIGMDVEVNVQGLEVWIDRDRAGPRSEVRGPSNCR
jgi:glyoxylase-like metal-dependent hydrolase (beta-lactamase superfamily II)